MGYNLLKGKKGLIFGALDEKSIAWNVAEKVNQEGGKFVLTNTDLAIRMGKINELAEKCNNSKVIPADVTKVEDIENLVEQTMIHFDGPIDFVLHSVGMSPNVRKNIHYTEINYDLMLKTLDISALSLHKILKVCMQKDAIREWGSVVALSYIAAQRTFSTYSDMAQAKALLESIVRSFGYHYGIRKKVRINTVSQSPTHTTAASGVKGINSFYSFSSCMSPLGNASAEDCASYCITLFSDLTKKVTLQNLYHDGGYSSMGISDRLVNDCFHCSGSCDNEPEK